MSHRFTRGTLVPFVSTLAAVIAVLGVLGSAPGSFGLRAFSVRGTAAGAPRDLQWWLGALQVPQAWQSSQGAGVTVAVLGTGVAADHKDLAGSVITGPDYTGSGRAPGGPFWGIEGTAAAGIIAGHGHGAGGGSGLVGIAPKARILSVRVTLEFNDPLGAEQAVAHRLPDAIAAGLRYAVAHGARVVDLPLDPGTLGLTGQGDPAAAGGSPAERAAVADALRAGVVLVAPAGDDGQGPGLVDYPAAYPGVVAVGATSRDGQLGLFSSKRSYVSLTAPGVGLVAAVPPDDYGQISTTSTASAVVAGVAALLLARYPHLTVAQVTEALAESTASAPAGSGTAAGTAQALPPLPGRSARGAGYGAVNAARALAMAALIAVPRKPPAPRGHPTPPARPARPSAAAATPATSALAGSLVRYVVVGLVALILLIGALLITMRTRKARREPAADRSREQPAARPRGRGLHEHRKAASLPGRASADPPAPDEPPASVPGTSPSPGVPVPGAPVPGIPVPGVSAPGASPVSGASPVFGGSSVFGGPPVSGGAPGSGAWQGGGLGEIASSRTYRPAITVARGGTAASRRGSAGTGGPPWEPAPEPEHIPSPLTPPMPSRSYPQSPGSIIRVPRDMTAPTAADPAPVPELPELPSPLTQQSLGFAAAPVPVDYVPPPGLTVHHEAPQGSGFAGPLAVPDFTAPPPGEAGAPEAGAPEAGPPEAGPPPAATTAASAIWDLAATDAFPVSTSLPELPAPAEHAVPPPAPGAVPPDDAPGASGG